MNDKIYIVKDTNTDEVVSIHKTMTGARDALVSYLKTQTGYTADEWQEFANENGYDNAEDFQNAIQTMPDYDEDMMMMVEEYDLKD